MNTRRWWGRPSLSVVVWLVFFLALTCSSQRIKLISADGDPCWHWRQGNWMLEHRSVLRADEFSHTRFGAPLVEMWWLSEIAFALAGNALGWFGAVALSAALIATTLWWLHRQLLREGGNAVVATGLTLLAASVCATHWLARPHLMTHLLTVVFAGMLRDELSTGKLFAALVPLTMLWANLHGAFVTAFVLIAIHAIGNWRLAGLLAACLLASLLNPNGWHLHEHVTGYLRSDALVNFVQEYAAPSFRKHIGLALLLVMLALTVAIVRPKWTATEMLLISVFGFLALRNARNAPAFALIAVPILAKPIASRWHRTFAGREGGGAWVAVTVVVALAVGPKWLPTEIPADKYPVDAVRYVRQHPEAVCGEIFNDVTWGGYLVLALPQHKVFVDGRVDFYGEKLINEFNIVDEIRPGWEAVLAKYNVGWTILPRAHRLNQILAPSWQAAYTDAVATVLCRRSP